MKQQNWHRTDLDVTNALRLNLKDYLLSDPYREGEHNIYIENTVGVWTIAPQTIFTDKFLGYLADNLLLQVDLAQIFYRTGGYQHPGAHVDLGQNNKLYGCGLNWTVDPDDAEMVWYDMPTTEGVSTKRSETDRNMEWPLEQLKEIDRVCIGQTPTLVRTDIPHTVDMGDNERWLISARFLWHTTWEDYMKSFKTRIVT
tara:strand:- start:5400 stop:5996 length:597 start_codon:yes stop_codon:yes gene_type:complete